MTLDRGRRALFHRCWQMVPGAVLPVALSGCGASPAAPTLPLAPSPPVTPPPSPAPPAPSPAPPPTTGVVAPVTAVDATATERGFDVRVDGSPLANLWGCARTLVMRQGIGHYVLMMRTDASSITALDAVCTHEGCVVAGVDGAVFVCPCHGSRYDHAGAVVRGPAPAPLLRLATTLSGDVLSVRL